jgi:hypothetical protein
MLLKSQAQARKLSVDSEIEQREVQRQAEIEADTTLGPLQEAVRKARKVQTTTPPVQSVNISNVCDAAVGNGVTSRRGGSA